MSKIGLAGAEIDLPKEPLASDYRVRRVPLTITRRALDGTLNATFVAMKWRWECKCAGLTAAEKNTLLTELQRLSSLSWQPPEGGTFTVVVVGEIETRPTERAPKRWTVGWSMEEV